MTVYRKIAVLMGGRSAEREVSLSSGRGVVKALREEGFDAHPLDPGDNPGQQLFEAKPDAVFNALHGRFGEDGTVQGALELAGVPFVGSGVTGSAIGMDKDVAKRLMRDAGVPSVPFVTTTAAAPIDFAAAAASLATHDMFVKPANMGSSVGVSRARSEEEFAKACELAFRYDQKILIEKAVDGAREIECSVLEMADGHIRASELGEIVPASKHGFYSYQAKYIDADGAGTDDRRRLWRLRRRRGRRRRHGHLRRRPHRCVDGSGGGCGRRYANGYSGRCAILQRNIHAPEGGRPQKINRSAVNTSIPTTIVPSIVRRHRNHARPASVPYSS